MEKKQLNIYILWTVGFKTAGFILVLCHLGIHIFIIRLAGMLRCFKMCKFWVHFQNWNKQKQKWYICLVFEHSIVNTGKSILHNMQSLTLTLTKHRSAFHLLTCCKNDSCLCRACFSPFSLGSSFTWRGLDPADVEHVDAVIGAVAEDVGPRGVQNKPRVTCGTQGITLRLWASHI